MIETYFRTSTGEKDGPVLELEHVPRSGEVIGIFAKEGTPSVPGPTRWAWYMVDRVEWQLATSDCWPRKVGTTVVLHVTRLEGRPGCSESTPS